MVDSTHIFYLQNINKNGLVSRAVARATLDVGRASNSSLCEVTGSVVVTSVEGDLLFPYGVEGSILKVKDESNIFVKAECVRECLDNVIFGMSEYDMCGMQCQDVSSCDLIHAQLIFHELEVNEAEDVLARDGDSMRYSYNTDGSCLYNNNAIDDLSDFVGSEMGDSLFDGITLIALA